MKYLTERHLNGNEASFTSSRPTADCRNGDARATGIHQEPGFRAAGATVRPGLRAHGDSRRRTEQHDRDLSGWNGKVPQLHLLARCPPAQGLSANRINPMSIQRSWTKEASHPLMWFKSDWISGTRITTIPARQDRIRMPPAGGITKRRFFHARGNAGYRPVCADGVFVYDGRRDCSANRGPVKARLRKNRASIP